MCVSTDGLQFKDRNWPSTRVISAINWLRSEFKCSHLRITALISSSAIMKKVERRKKKQVSIICKSFAIILVIIFYWEKRWSARVVVHSTGMALRWALLANWSNLEGGLYANLIACKYSPNSTPFSFCHTANDPEPERHSSHSLKTHAMKTKVIITNCNNKY